MVTYKVQGFQASNLHGSVNEYRFMHAFGDGSSVLFYTEEEPSPGVF